MKLLLTSLLISVTLIGKGQTDSSGFSGGGGGKVTMPGWPIRKGDSMFASGGTLLPQTFGFFEKEFIGIDTLKQVLLLSDSTGRVWQDAGYSVRNKRCCINGNMSESAVYQPVPYYEHLYYLDKNKKRFTGSIYVWMSK